MGYIPNIIKIWRAISWTMENHYKKDTHSIIRIKFTKWVRGEQPCPKCILRQYFFFKSLHNFISLRIYKGTCEYWFLLWLYNILHCWVSAQHYAKCTRHSLLSLFEQFHQCMHIVRDLNVKNGNCTFRLLSVVFVFLLFFFRMNFPVFGDWM